MNNVNGHGASVYEYSRIVGILREDKASWKRQKDSIQYYCSVLTYISMSKKVHVLYRHTKTHETKKL